MADFTKSVVKRVVSSLKKEFAIPESGRLLKSTIRKGLEKGSEEVVARHFKGEVPKSVKVIREKFVKNQLNYLAKYVNDVYKGRVGILPSRSQMYANSLHLLDAELLAHKATLGSASWERRIMGCETGACSECEGLSQRGWVKFGTLPAIGDTICKSNCKCKFEYSYEKKKPRKSSK